MHKPFVALVLAVASLLSACDGNTKAPEASNPPSDVVVASQAGTGFTVGPRDAKQTVYVYFDAQCPHCGELWKASQPLLGEVKMVWIPVGIMNRASVSQGAALLGAFNPAQAMTAHEVELSTNRRGMKADFPSSDQRKVIEANTALFTRIGGNSIPLVLSKHAVTGELVRQEGSAATPALRQLLGLAP
jgi:thiol:disulfide interchange protein DsbG